MLRKRTKNCRKLIVTICILYGLQHAVILIDVTIHMCLIFIWDKCTSTPWKSRLKLMIIKILKAKLQFIRWCGFHFSACILVYVTAQFISNLVGFYVLAGEKVVKYQANEVQDNNNNNSSTRPVNHTTTTTSKNYSNKNTSTTNTTKPLKLLLLCAMCMCMHYCDYTTLAFYRGHTSSTAFHTIWQSIFAMYSIWQFENCAVLSCFTIGSLSIAHAHIHNTTSHTIWNWLYGAGE